VEQRPVSDGELSDFPKTMLFELIAPDSQSLVSKGGIMVLNQEYRSHRASLAKMR
jgi:hypothetical protein